MKRFLKRGDIFEVTEGMRVLAEIPQKFCFSKSLNSKKMYKNSFEVGKKYVISEKNKETYLEMLKDKISEILASHEIEMDNEDIKNFISKAQLNMEKEEFDTSIYIGKYVVVNVDSYERKVTAKKLTIDKFDSESLEVEFFQNDNSSPFVDCANIRILGEVTEWCVK